MGTLVIPAAAYTTPAASDVNAYNDAVAAVLGGQVGATRYGGAIDAANLVASPLFRNDQKENPRAVFSAPLVALGSVAQDLLAPLLTPCELVGIVLVDSSSLVSGDTLTLVQDGAPILSVTFPSPGTAAPSAGSPYSWSFAAPIGINPNSYLLVEVRDSDGNVSPAGRNDVRLTLALRALHVAAP